MTDRETTIVQLVSGALAVAVLTVDEFRREYLRPDLLMDVIDLEGYAMTIVKENVQMFHAADGFGGSTPTKLEAA